MNKHERDKQVAVEADEFNPENPRDAAWLKHCEDTGAEYLDEEDAGDAQDLFFSGYESAQSLTNLTYLVTGAVDLAREEYSGEKDKFGYPKYTKSLTDIIEILAKKLGIYD